eukprot:scaffold140415_cov32-Tisochrysis_lutea.AAC.1
MGVSRLDGSIFLSPAASAETPRAATLSARARRPPKVEGAGGTTPVVGAMAAESMARRERSPCSGRRSAPAAASAFSKPSISVAGTPPGWSESNINRRTRSSGVAASSPVGDKSWTSVDRSSLERDRPSSSDSSRA